MKHAPSKNTNTKDLKISNNIGDNKALAFALTDFTATLETKSLYCKTIIVCLKNISPLLTMVEFLNIL